MGGPIVFETTLKLKGELPEIEELTHRIGDMVTEMEAVDFIYPRPFPGGWPILIQEILDRKKLASLVDGMPRLKVIEGIKGGMRNPHLHLEDQIVLLDRGRFKDVVGHVAMALATQFAEEAEYIDVVEAMHDFVPGMG